MAQDARLAVPPPDESVAAARPRPQESAPPAVAASARLAAALAVAPVTAATTAAGSGGADSGVPLLVPASAPRNDLVPEYWREKYEREASRNWDKFYKAHKTNFFKDRHWLTRAFPLLAPPPELAPASTATAAAAAEGADDGGDAEEARIGADLAQLEKLERLPPLAAGYARVTVLELGCGVGNTMFPLLLLNPTLYVIGLDFAPSAIALVRAHRLYDEARCSAHVCDLTSDELPAAAVAPGSVDVATLFFVLSAVAPAKMPAVLRRLRAAMRPGGVACFRDFGEGDLGEQRLDCATQHSKKLEDNFYVRSDGTRSFYYSTDSLQALFVAAGWEVLTCTVVERLVHNRKLGGAMRRVWIQGTFRRPFVDGAIADSTPGPG